MTANLNVNFGSSWENPIWIGKWRVYRDREPLFNLSWACVHDDFDGAEDANDNRYGYAVSISECLLLIEELEEA